MADVEMQDKMAEGGGHQPMGSKSEPLADGDDDNRVQTEEVLHTGRAG